MHKFLRDTKSQRGLAYKKTRIRIKQMEHERKKILRRHKDHPKSISIAKQTAWL